MNNKPVFYESSVELWKVHSLSPEDQSGKKQKIEKQLDVLLFFPIFREINNTF